MIPKTPLWLWLSTAGENSASAISLSLFNTAKKKFPVAVKITPGSP
jgi:hypothetical protein